MKQKLTITTEILDRVVYGMENQKEKLFLDPKDGTLKHAGEECGLIPLPPWTSFNGYRLMDNFIATLPDHTLAARLRDALNSGVGVFRRFKDILEERPLNKQLWQQYRKRAMQMEAYSWLSRWSDALDLLELPPEPEFIEDITELEFTLRPAIDKDIELLEKWDKEAMLERYPLLSDKERERAIFRERGNTTMNSDDILVSEAMVGQMAGFSWLRVMDREGWLLQLFVLPEFRGMGVGRMLLEQSFAGALRRGVTRLGTYVSESGKFLNDWLKRNGFQAEVVAWTKSQEYYTET